MFRPALAMALLIACNNDDKSCDTGDSVCDTATSDTDPYEGPTTVDTITYDCDSSNWWYDVATVGWTGGGQLDIVELGEGDTPVWAETHPLASTGYDEYGYWDHLYLELIILQEPACDPDNYDAEDACYKIQESGVNTLWACDTATKNALTWSVTVFEYADPTSAADCVAWGLDPAEYPGCVEFDFN